MKKIVVFVCLLAFALGGSAARRVVWVIDPGHGGHDTGCEGTMSKEKDLTLAIAKEVGRLVKQNIKGVRVVYTRERDTYPTLPRRCELANDKGAQLFLSIHVNDAENKFASGTESYYATNVPQSGANMGKSELLALLLQRQYLANGRAVSRGVKQEALYVCEHTNMPSVLTEVGFISNLEEEAFMNSKQGQALLAKAIYEALAEWQKLTANGCDKRELRNLRYAYMDPRRESKPVPKITVVKEKTDDALAANVPVTAANQAQPQQSATDEARPKAEAEQPQTKKEESKQEEAAKKELVKKADGKNEEAKQEEKRDEDKRAQAKPDGSKQTQSDAKPASPKPAAQKNADAKAESAKPVYSIQIMTSPTILKIGDYRLKGETEIRYVQTTDRYKLLVGNATTYQDAKNLLAQVRDKFPDAFIVAYVGDRQVTTGEAMKMEK